MAEAKKLDIKASCTWGEGPDVLVTLDDKPFWLYEKPDQKNRAVHGIVRKGSFDLTRNEALDLATQLFAAAAVCKELEDGYTAMMEHDAAIHNAEVEHMKSGVDDEELEASQQQGLPASKGGKNIQTAVKDLQAHLRKKLLHS